MQLRDRLREDPTLLTVAVVAFAVVPAAVAVAGGWLWLTAAGCQSVATAPQVDVGFTETSTDAGYAVTVTIAGGDPVPADHLVILHDGTEQPWGALDDTGNASAVVAPGDAVTVGGLSAGTDLRVVREPGDPAFDAGTPTGACGAGTGRTTVGRHTVGSPDGERVSERNA